MYNINFTTSFVVGQTPQEVFNAINKVRGWWSEEIEGVTDKQDAEWSYHYKDLHSCRMKVTELIPEKRVVWLVLENKFSFTKDQSEWLGNNIIFDITPEGNKTRLTFTQQGLVPDNECYEVCSNAWTQYVQQSLQSLITPGKGLPNSRECGIMVR